MSLLNSLSTQIKTIFEEYPYRFFTEHDIHSELARIATESLMKEGSLYAETSDHHKIGRLHHEYPTPFRCLMDHYNFRMIREDEFKRERRKNKFNAKRGRIDLVVLNSDYVSSNPLNVATGKNYRDLLANLKQQRFPVLDLAIEVVYHATIDEKPHTGIMRRRVESIVQDYKKLTALMKFRQVDDLSFCKEAAMLFFSNTVHRGELEKTLSSLKIDAEVAFSSYVYPKTT